MRQKIIKNLKKEERIKFPKFSYKVYENESLDLTGMTGMVIDDEQSNITIELDDEKYKETLYPNNCVGFSLPEHENLLVEVIDPGGFICPECGSKESGEEIFMSKEPLAGKNKNPWASVLQQIECNDCKMIIPNHLAKRWDNLSIEKAKEEWVKLYRKGSKKQKF